MEQNELMHRSHKYLSRKWKNGRWVYTYKNTEYENAQKELVKADINQQTARAKWAGTEDYKGIYGINMSTNDNKITKKERDEYKSISKANKNNYDAYKKAGEKYVAAEKKYKKVKLKTLPSRIIGNGAAAIANILSGLG